MALIYEYPRRVVVREFRKGAWVDVPRPRIDWWHVLGATMLVLSASLVTVVLLVAVTLL